MPFLLLNVIEKCMKVIRFIRGYVDYMYCSWKKEKELWNNRSLIDYDTYEITSSCGDITT